MAPSMSGAEARAPQDVKYARAALRPVVPVIPLHYMKKKPTIPSPPVATLNQTTARQAAVEKAPKAATHTTPPLPLSAAYNSGDIENAVSKEEDIEDPVHVRGGLNHSEIKEAVESSTEQAKFDESDKSSTLANESRPATTEPRSSSLTTAPPFDPMLQDIAHQKDDSSSLSSRDAYKPFPMQYAQQEFGIRSVHPASNYPKSHSPSPLPSILGESQLRHPLEGAAHFPPTNGHSQHFTNGFPPMGPPPPPGFFHPQDPQIARRQMMPLSSPDGYSPSITPAFSDQQRFSSYPSSVQNDLEGNGQLFYNPSNGTIAPAAIHGVINGHANGIHVNPQARPGVNGSQTGPPATNNGHFVSRHHMPPQFPPGPMHDHLDGLLEYLLAQVGNPTYADYTLELHYSDGRAHPVRIPGHNLLFARSPVLNNLMATTTGQLSIDGSRRLLRLETDDRFVTSDGFHMAVSRLYGGQLLDEGGPSMTRAPGNPEVLVGRFNFALGYAASGHVLHIPPVVDRGIMVAAQLINWDTVEKAVDFAIDGGLDSHWTLEPSHNGYSRSTYGRVANDLLSSALNFTLQNFPADFVLDTSVPDFAHNSRLPAIQSSVQGSRPITAHPRLSSIKFGDLAIHDDDNSATSSTFYVLSKLLIGLPFPLLKFVLEHRRLGNVEGWATIKLRQNVIHTVIQERENRRLQVFNSPTPNSKRLENRTIWETVGWREHVISSPEAPDLSTITRTWVDFISPNHN